jgi:hypothetical protein
MARVLGNYRASKPEFSRYKIYSKKVFGYFPKNAEDAAMQSLCQQFFYRGGSYRLERTWRTWGTWAIDIQRNFAMGPASEKQTVIWKKVIRR